MEWIWSEYGELPPEAAHIRKSVFMDEQGFSVEFDDIDAKSYHVMLVRDEKIIGTARLFFEDDKKTMHIGRVAVLPEERGGGTGSSLLTACCEKARTFGAQHIILGAQRRAMHFYESNGFEAYGEPYDVEGCPHQMMEKQL